MVQINTAMQLYIESAQSPTFDFGAERHLAFPQWMRLLCLSRNRKTFAIRVASMHPKALCLQKKKVETRKEQTLCFSAGCVCVYTFWVPMHARAAAWESVCHRIYLHSRAGSLTPVWENCKTKYTQTDWASSSLSTLEPRGLIETQRKSTRRQF
jgi:hypothetical protein